VSEPPSHIRAATRGDLAEVVELLNACDVAEVGEPDTSAEDVETDWGMDGFDLATDTWVAEGERGITGYAYTGDQFRTGELEADVWVHPEHAEPGLADRLLALAERRASELAQARGYADRSLDVFTLATNRAKRGLLEAHGFALLRTVYRLRIDLAGAVEPSALPDGFELRPFRPGRDDEAMHFAMNDAFLDHFRQSEEPLEAWKARLLGHPDFDPELFLLAWHGDQPCAALIAYDHGDLGWVKGLGVRRPWRRRGLGAALLGHAFARFAARGQWRVELGVDAEGETKPLRLYESVGMRLAHAYELFAKPLS
jgi:mycothiol synthase